MTELEFWEANYLAIACAFRFSDSPIAFPVEMKNLCAIFADRSADAWREKKTLLREERIHRETCKDRLIHLQRASAVSSKPLSSAEEQEFADLEAQDDNGDFDAR